MNKRLLSLFLFCIIAYSLFTGCGSSVVSNSGTPIEQAEAALNNGQYATAISLSTSVIDNPSSSNSDLESAYSIRGQAQSGDVLKSCKDTNSYGLISMINDGITAQGENVNAIAAAIVLSPEALGISSFRLTPLYDVTTDEAINFIKGLEYLISNLKPSGFLKECYYGFVDLDYLFTQYRSGTADEITVEFCNSLIIVGSLIINQFGENGAAIITEATLSKLSTDQVKSGWCAINNVTTTEVIAASTTEVFNVRGGVTWASNSSVAYTDDPNYKGQYATALKTLAASVKDKIQAVNAGLVGRGTLTGTEFYHLLTGN